MMALFTLQPLPPNLSSLRAATSYQSKMRELVGSYIVSSRSDWIAVFTAWVILPRLLELTPYHQLGYCITERALYLGVFYLFLNVLLQLLESLPFTPRAICRLIHRSAVTSAYVLLGIPVDVWQAARELFTLLKFVLRYLAIPVVGLVEVLTERNLNPHDLEEIVEDLNLNRFARLLRVLF